VHTTGSPLIARLRASSRQSTPAKALHEYAPARAHHLHLPLRRRRRTPAAARRQLTKGESLRTLRRDPFFADQGHLRRRLDDQTDQALCLTLITTSACCRRPPTPAMRSASRCDRRAIAAAGPAATSPGDESRPRQHAQLHRSACGRGISVRTPHRLRHA
jgi:hypothetical protein